MNVFSKWIWGIFSTLMMIGFIGLILWLLNLVLSGQGNENYISGRGYKLTPIGALALLDCLRIGLFCG